MRIGYPLYVRCHELGLSSSLVAPHCFFKVLPSHRSIMVTSSWEAVWGWLEYVPMEVFLDLRLAGIQKGFVLLGIRMCQSMWHMPLHSFLAQLKTHKSQNQGLVALVILLVKALRNNSCSRKP